ncbi:MAG TPA: alpha/beta hydrolase-fold protein [Thermoanaerobaculia bacterium]|nr:alpha/beta hydrolase-fold protein [Thermoanaerobaculia bacterium]
MIDVAVSWIDNLEANFSYNHRRIQSILEVRAMKRYLPMLFLILMVMAGITTPLLLAGDSGKDIVIGKAYTISSKILNEERTILVYTPFGYENPEVRLPVLYLLDGEAHFHHISGLVQFFTKNGLISPMIVVAISNTDRKRDFTPTRVEKLPTGGGADQFLDFMEKELFPMVESKFRTQPYRILVGHSLGGLFAVHAFLSRPNLFQATFAISPWLVYDVQSTMNDLKVFVKKKSPGESFLYISTGNEEPEVVQSVKSFIQALEEAKVPDLVDVSEFFENENHGSVVHQSVYNGLRHLYKKWPITSDLVNLGVEGIEKKFQELSKEFGYEIPIPEGVLNLMGYYLLEMDRIEDAVSTFKRNVELYPESANVYDSLGEGLEALEQLEMAKKNYMEAIERAKKLKDPNLPIFREHLERVRQKLESEISMGEKKILKPGSPSSHPIY